MPEQNTTTEEIKEKLPFYLSLKNDLFSWLQALTFALVILIVAFTFFGRIISVDGSSMVPSLHHQDRLLLQSAFFTPSQGDVVVLTKPFGNTTEPIVKRIIATGGQTVDIDYSQGLVYVDGEVLPEPYLGEMMLEPGSSYLNITHCEVPQGSVFVMGDNRNASDDSRDERLGPVDTRYILGKAVLIMLPFQSFGAVPGPA